MQEPIIRRAGPPDAEALSAIGRETFVQTFGHLYPAEDLGAFLEEAYGLGRTEADLADVSKAAWLVETAGRVVGYALAGTCSLPHPDVAPGDRELKRFYLLQGQQGGGLGSRLFDTVLEWLQRDGPTSVWIGVWSENHGARRFYERRGFSKVGEYGFPVGGTIDLEFILQRSAEDFCAQSENLTASEHNFA